MKNVCQDNKTSAARDAGQTDEEIIARHDLKVRHRARVELEIVHTLIKALRKNKYEVEVDDGGEVTKGDEQALVSAIFAVDEATINTRRERVSFVSIVLGNGAECISDYGTSLEATIEPLMEWIDTQTETGKF